MDGFALPGKRCELGRLLQPAAYLSLAFLCVFSCGCTRRWFRLHADEEAGQVLAQKDCYPAWKIEQFHVYPDPRSRFADPSDPDHPPMPPDDPAAWKLSPHPQKPCKVAQIEGTGYLKLMAYWDEQNRAEAAAAGQAASGQTSQGSATQTNPASEQAKAAEAASTPGRSPATGTTSTGATTSLSSSPSAPRPYLLKLEQALELGLINSREYQDAREDLFLTALPVTLERFSFAAQFFAAGQAIREWAGSQTPGGPQNNWMLDSNVGFSKLFSTGALLLFNFANQTIFNLTGTGRSVTSQSTINLDFIQPLLRGGGRAVTLEPLTQAERNLLYEIRNYARFREEFYVAIAGGGGGSITGSAFQPTGVIAAQTFTPAGGVGGTSGLIPGVIPSVPTVGNPGLPITPGASGRAALQVALAAPVSGYLTTLLQAAQMRVDLYNIQKLEGYLQLARAMEEGGDISRLQVDQFEQQLLLRRTTLLSDQQQYLQSLDQFKLQLGLPTDLPLELDDTPFRGMNQQFQRYEDLFNEFEAASNEPLRFNAENQVPTIRREFLRIYTSSPIVRGTRFSSQIQAYWSAWQKLSADELRRRLADYREERRRLLEKQTDLQNKGSNLSEADQQRLNRLNADIDLGEFESILREYESQPWSKVQDPVIRRRQQQALFRYVVNAFILVLAEARTERVLRLRELWPDAARLCLNGLDLLKADVDEAEAAVVQQALTNRLDLMNVRAQVTDAWRQIAIFANALLGVFNVQYAMTATTPAGQNLPFDFSGSRTTHQLIFTGALPLVRKQERNNYRASLINYERSRRILQRAEDQVAYDVRGELRQLRQLEETYRIQQRQVELAYMTVENSLDTFRAPPAPIPAGQVGADVATRAAALTQQLIMAQSSLYNAQFQMTTIWITYLNTRLQLYRDMELMPLDSRGVWTDDVATCQCPPSGADRSGGPDGTGGASERLPERKGGVPERLPEPQPGPASTNTPARPGR
jgi:outer membrane protein TolC